MYFISLWNKDRDIGKYFADVEEVSRKEPVPSCQVTPTAVLFQCAVCVSRTGGKESAMTYHHRLFSSSNSPLNVISSNYVMGSWTGASDTFTNDSGVTDES
jgi:hypothetical protein